MSRAAAAADQSAANTDSATAEGALGGYDTDIADYMSNVNSQLSAGNPYQSKSYLENQNLETSGAMHSANDAADQEIQQTAARTGTNTAAIAGEEAELGREGERDMTNYTATRDTENEDKWLQDQNELTRDQLAGAQSEAGVYGSAIGGQDSTLNSMTTADDAEDQMWASLAGAAAAGAGTGAGIAASCWVAARVFGGWNDPRTSLVREWIYGPFARTWYGARLAALYTRIGRTVADKWMPRSRTLTWALRRLFEAALRRAQEWKADRG